MKNRECQSEGTMSVPRMAPQLGQVQYAGANASSSAMWQASGVRVRPVLGSPTGVLIIQQLKGNRAVSQMLAVQQSTEAQDLREPSDEEIYSAAAEGIRTPATTLPFLDRIQASFGRHSIRHVKAHIGAEAAKASRAMNAVAFASGDHVVFGGTPDLRTAAHEAVHIVQQRAGVQLAGGIGREGDTYERHADTIAAAVVAGRSAERLLAQFAATPTAGHLPLEAWYVMQQKQGMANITMQMKDSININANPVLEKEADVIGMEALSLAESCEVHSLPRNGADMHGSVVQLQKKIVRNVSNLRSLDNERQKITIPAGTEVDLVEPVESLQFELQLFWGGVARGKGPWHSKIEYNGVYYWIKNSHLGESNNSEIKLEVSVNKHQVAEVENFENRTRALQNPLDDLEEYIEPKVATVKEEHKMGGLAAGMDVNYNEVIKKGYPTGWWRVKPIKGQLCNCEDMPITGGGAWVLSMDQTDQTLRGSQRSEAPGSSTFIIIGKTLIHLEDMESHEQAGKVHAIWAGEMEVVNGKVVSINNRSGTYHFAAEANLNIVKYLLDNKIITGDEVAQDKLQIRAWTQTGLDRKGETDTWRGFEGGQRLDKRKELQDEIKDNSNDDEERNFSFEGPSTLKYKV